MSPKIIIGPLLGTLTKDTEEVLSQQKMSVVQHSWLVIMILIIPDGYLPGRMYTNAKYGFHNIGSYQYLLQQIFSVKSVN